MIYLIPSITAFALTILGCLFALRFFPRWGLLDKPHKYGLKRKPIPYFGGLVIYSVFVLCAFLFFPLDKHIIGLILGGGLLTIVNFYDDKHGLSPFFRLGVQILSALVLILCGIGITHITNPFGGELFLNQFEIPFLIEGTNYQFTLFADIFTIIWILGMTNTMNWLDGLNGLSSGVTAIGAFTLFFLSISERVDQPEIAILAIILGSICVAFWFFDFYPAKILMGDTGSMFLGFTLATLAIFSGGKVATAFMVMGFPILDSAWVIIRRLKNKQSPLKGDLSHLHHRLLGMGISERKVILLMYLLCGVGISALFLNTWQKFVAIISMFVIMVFGARFLVQMQKRRKTRSLSTSNTM